jgi:cysteine desulfurase
MVEHPAVLNTCRALKESGHTVIELEVDGDGCLDIDKLSSIPIDSDTLVSLMWANNETGVLFPIDNIAQMVKSRGGSLHTDAVQAVGKIPVNVAKTPVDYLAISGHKIHAPKGVGALYMRKGSKLPPLLFGGHQEDGLRAGTENVPYIVGLGVAAELALKRMDEENSRVRKMRDRLESSLLPICPGAKLNGHVVERLPNTSNISFEFIEGEGILLLLDELNISASSGSACTTGSLEPSHVMRAMGVPYTMAHSSIRFSFSVYNTEDDVDMVIKSLPPIIERLRAISPYVQ